MNRPEVSRKNSITQAPRNGEKGSALVLALFVLALISVFVAFALTRTAAEAAAVGNETAEARTLYASQGSLEVMTRNFNKVFERKLNPSATDLNRVRNGVVPGISAAGGGEFGTPLQEVDQIGASSASVLTGGPYAGLYAIRDTWRLRTTVTDVGGTQVRLTRNILNNRIPIFQFGIFYDDDLELFRPPRFSFGGRVHSNRHFFVSPGGEGVYFDSRVTAAGHVITQSWRNWYTGDNSNNQTWIKNASGSFKQLLPTQGSVLNGTPNVFGSGRWADPDLPSSRLNSNWASQSAIFDGNLQSQTKPLKLPLKVGNANADLIELVKRGKEVPDSSGGDLAWNGSSVVPVTPVTDPETSATADNEIQRSERFSNKTGIRISLADSKAKLPGCANGVGQNPVTTECGVRLDGHMNGTGADRLGPPTLPLPSPVPPSVAESSRGYQPKSMRTTSGGAFNYTPTRVNGERLYSGNPVWIKVETVRTDDVTGAVITQDITQDFLSMGMTEQAPNGVIDIAGSYNESPLTSTLTNTAAQPATSGGTDSRSVIKIQRFAIAGPAIPSLTTNKYLVSNSSWNMVRRFSGATDAGVVAGCTVLCTAPTAANSNDDPNTANQSREQYGHLKKANIPGQNNVAIVPFPIEMFDTREGEHYDKRSTTYYSNLSRLTRNGVMSMIDVDVANLRRFFRGDFNGLFPTDTPFATSKGGVGLTNTDIPQLGGWVIYFSDRRGDFDFDGEFDMEDIYGSGHGNDGTKQPGEDANHDGVLNTRYGVEAERYNTNTIAPDEAAVNDHKYYRRGIRLINGTTIPGIYDAGTPANTRGITFSSENGIYVQGNFNATGAASPPSSGNTPYDQYYPFNGNFHIPASIVADAVTILSNAWNDAKSFSSPYDEGGRLASDTQIRFAMIAGDTISTREQSPNQGGLSPRLNGGVHNFKRFLERWTGERLDYAGSLINLFNSRNNSGSFKCCNTVYDPPVRNWVFDSTFLDPARIPPGTPFFQYVQTTGFERSTE